MTQYNYLNVKLPKFQIKKLKSATKHVTEVILKHSSSMICNFIVENSFTQKFLLTDRKVLKLCKSFFIIIH